MKASIENPVVIAVISHEDSYMPTYEVLDYGSDEWLEVKYKYTCLPFKKTNNLDEMMDLALTEMDCGNYAKQGYKIKSV